MGRCVSSLLAHERVPGLDATPAGRQVYLRLGFLDIYRLTRYFAASPAGLMTPPESGVRVRPVMTGDLPAVSSYTIAPSSVPIASTCCSISTPAFLTTRSWRRSRAPSRASCLYGTGRPRCKSDRWSPMNLRSGSRSSDGLCAAYKARFASTFSISTSSCGRRLPRTALVRSSRSFACSINAATASTIHNGSWRSPAQNSDKFQVLLADHLEIDR